MYSTMSQLRLPPPLPPSLLQSFDDDDLASSAFEPPFYLAFLYSSRECKKPIHGPKNQQPATS